MKAATPFAVARALVAVLTFGLLVSACGSAGSTDPGDDSTTTSAAGQQPWLLRYDEATGGGDGEELAAVYLKVEPGSGKVVTVRTPKILGGNASGAERVLMVDADHRFALRDSRPSKTDRARHQVTLYPLAEGAEPRTVRLDGIKPGWVSFDPVSPGKLWVVDGRRVWTVDVSSEKATAQDPLPGKAGFIFAGGFDKNSGRPYVESVDSMDTLPQGMGDDDTSAVKRRGGQLLTTETGTFEGLPDPKCPLASGFKSGDATEIWCVDGRDLVFKRLSDGQWKQQGEPIKNAVSESLLEFVFALPPRK